LFEKFINLSKYCNVYALAEYERGKVGKDLLKQLSASRAHNLLRERS